MKEVTMSKQTAVEWLVDAITNSTIPARKAIEKAKSMEIKIINDAYNRGLMNGKNNILKNINTPINIRKKNLYEALPDVFEVHEGVLLAKKFKIGERTFKYYLNDYLLFHKISHGKYLKVNKKKYNANRYNL